MKKQNLELITYVKNGIEKEVILNFFNKGIILKDICEYKIESQIKISDDIEYIKFSNVVFDKTFDIICNEDTVCVLENCVIGSKQIPDWLKLSGGKFKIINCYFVNVIGIYIDNINEFDYIYNNLLENFNPRLKLQIDNSNNVVIEDNDTINSIQVTSKNITFKNNFELDKLFLKGNKISIGNNIKTSWGIIRIEALEKLNLNNCLIKKDGFGGRLFLKAPTIIGKNYTLKSVDVIEINGFYYDKKNHRDDYIVVTDNIVNKKVLVDRVSNNIIEKRRILSKKSRVVF